MVRDLLHYALARAYSIGPNNPNQSTYQGYQDAPTFYSSSLTQQDVRSESSSFFDSLLFLRYSPTYLFAPGRLASFSFSLLIFALIASSFNSTWLAYDKNASFVSLRLKLDRNR